MMIIFDLFLQKQQIGGEEEESGVRRGEEEEGGVRSGPGEARTILLLHIISTRQVPNLFCFFEFSNGPH